MILTRQTLRAHGAISSRTRYCGGKRALCQLMKRKINNKKTVPITYAKGRSSFKKQSNHVKRMRNSSKSLSANRHKSPCIIGSSKGHHCNHGRLSGGRTTSPSTSHWQDIRMKEKSLGLSLFTESPSPKRKVHHDHHSKDDETTMVFEEEIEIFKAADSSLCSLWTWMFGDA